MNIPIVILRGDGIGRSIDSTPGISELAQRVMDSAVSKVYGSEHTLEWIRALAGNEAREANHSELTDEAIAQLREDEQREVYLPQTTIDKIREVGLALKGPLTTPVGGGFRSINVGLRQIFDLYVCLRPVEYIPGVPAPNKNADKVRMAIFRENVEDIYVGIEYEAGTEKARELVAGLGSGKLNPEWNYGIGIKPVSEQGSKRLIRRAIQYAIDKGYPSVTLMHKGNIMKFTEGAFAAWGYEVARDEFSKQVVAEKNLDGKTGKVIIKDRIADSMFQQVQLRPEDYSVIATTNLNGDYISDALAALVGGLGFAPGANLGEKIAIFEATHGTAPKYTGQDKANPGSLILSGALLLDHVGLDKAADVIRSAIRKTVAESASAAQQGPGNELFVTYDIARQFSGYSSADGVPSSKFVERIISHLAP